MNHAVFVNPFEVIKNEIIKRPEEPRYFHAAKNKFARRGISGFVRGTTAAIMRDSLAFSMFFGMANSAKSCIREEYSLEKGDIEYSLATLAGGALGALAAEIICHTANGIRDRALQEEITVRTCWSRMSLYDHKFLFTTMRFRNFATFIPSSFGYFIFCSYNDDN